MIMMLASIKASIKDHYQLTWHRPVEVWRCDLRALLNLGVLVETWGESFTVK